MYNKKRTKSVLEALMYIWGDPLEIKDAAEAAEVTYQEAKECFLELQKEYDQEGRGLMIRQINSGFQFATRPEYGEQIEKLCTPVKTRKLSQAALEVLAIVAYKQPVTKSEIDSIRGIKCDRVIEGLMKKELVEEQGRSSGIGRPILYGTSKTFLQQFGFTSLKDLPEIDDIEDVLAMDHADREEDFAPDMQMSLEELGTELGTEVGTEVPMEVGTEVGAEVDTEDFGLQNDSEKPNNHDDPETE